MTTRNVIKNFVGMEDLLAGVGTLAQTRNLVSYTLGRIDVPYAVSTEAAMIALDVTRFTLARIYSSTTAFVEYRYDEADVTGISPTAGAGTWVIVGLVGNVQALSGAGAVDVVTLTTQLTTTAADALTLVDGREGQTKYVVMAADGGDGTLTPTNLANGTTLTFDDIGDSAQLFFTGGSWHFMGGTATLA